MSGLYAADGSFNLTVVDGSSYTGLYASDGSYNVVVSAGGSDIGLYHKCGALNVTKVANSTLTGRYAPDGSLYVSLTPYNSSGAQKVTCVSGSLGGGYIAKAVECTNWASLQQLGTSISNSHVSSGSIWVNYSNDYLNYGGLTFITGVPSTNWGTEQGFEFYNFDRNGPGDIAINVSDGATIDIVSASVANAITNDVWYNCLWSLDSQNGIINLYIGDTNVFLQSYVSPFPTSPTFPFVIPWNGTDILLGTYPASTGPSSGLRFADCWISSTQFVDWSNPTVRAKVHNGSGKPVNLGDGSLITGTKPEMFFSGDHTGFLVNQGTSGAFTSVGTFIDASTSPSN